MPTKLYRACRNATFAQEIKMAQFPGRFWCMLFGPDSTVMDDEPSSVDEFATLDEAGNVRMNLAAFTTFTDVAQNRVYIPSNLMIPLFTMAAGEIVAGALVYYSPSGGGHGDDALNIPMWGFELPFPKEFSKAENYTFPFTDLEFMAEMSSFGERAYLIGRKNLLENQTAWNITMRFALVMEGSNFFNMANPFTIADITNIFDGSGYSPQDVTLVITDDPDRDRVMLDAPDPSFGALGNGTGAIIGGVFYIVAAVNGVANTLTMAMKLPSPVTPGGAAFSFPFPTDGICYL